MYVTKRLALFLLLTLALATSCRPDETGAVQFAISAQSLSTASVTRVTVTSSGPNMPSITTELVRTNGVWGGVIGNIPAGSNREFHARAFGGGENPLFEGSTSGVTISAGQITLVAITLQELNPPPPFSNEAPIIQSVVATPTTVQAGGFISLQSTAQDLNVGDTISYSWTAASGSFANPTHPGTSWTAPNTAGLVSITLTVTDSHGVSSSVILTVNVVNGSGEGGASLDVRFNSWPVVSALSISVTPLDVGQPTTATVTASDSDGDSLSYQWTATCAGLWTNATSSTASFSPSAIPTGACNNCQLTVTLADGRGGQTTGTVALCVATATVNRFPPTIVRSYQSSLTAQPAQQITFEATASDPQNSSLSFSWSAATGTLGTPQNTADTSRIVWNAPSCRPTGTSVSITAAVANAYGLSVTHSFGVTGLPTCAASGWASTGSMASPRIDHTATLLFNGKVLVAGGSSGSTLGSAELYDPATGTWSPTGSMVSPRSFHRATLLPNGKVLVTGGQGTAATELYDPATGTWASTGSMTSNRGAHTATLLSNGKVLVVGGAAFPSYRASAEVYDPVTGTWAPTGSMSTSRAFHTATLMPNGKVLVAGGMANNGSDFLASAELYDPATGTWATTGAMASDRYSFRETLLSNGKVFVGGGNSGTQASPLASSELYDPATGTWTSTGSMAAARRNYTVTPLSNGNVLAAGGFNSSNGVLSGAEVYDPGIGAWASTNSMAAARTDHTATLLANGQVLVVGGFGFNVYLASAEIFTP